MIVPAEQLVPGLYVDLQLHWLKHPFASARFKITSDKEIQIIKRLKPDGVLVFPDRSDGNIVLSDPGNQATQDDSVDGDSAIHDEEIDLVLREKEAQARKAEALRVKQREARREFQRKAKIVRQITSDMKTRPANAIQNADEFVDELAAAFEGEGNLLVSLVELGSGRHADFNHAANVMMLSLMLGSVEGLNHTELKTLGTGALLHDIGKVEIPGSIRNKTKPLTPAEQGVMNRHPLIGRRLVERVRSMSEDVLNIVEHHHEFLDGSGYPAGLGAEALSPMVRIVSIVNMFDNLCNPPDIADAMTSNNALGKMYKFCDQKLDRRLVARLVETMGIYPPGTVVELSDENLGLVISADSTDKLRPAVLVYDPAIAKEDALIIDLMEYEGVRITRALRPGEYPPEIHDYFGIQDRLGYMVEKQRK